MNIKVASHTMKAKLFGYCQTITTNIIIAAVPDANDAIQTSLSSSSSSFSLQPPPGAWSPSPYVLNSHVPYSLLPPTRIYTHLPKAHNPPLSLSLLFTVVNCLHPLFGTLTPCAQRNEPKTASTQENYIQRDYHSNFI